jgi:hypothetical protein
VHELVSHAVTCPYCAERFEILVDGSVPHQDYIEDCEVCCRPITFDVTVTSDGVVFVVAKHENE